MPMKRSKGKPSAACRCLCWAKLFRSRQWIHIHFNFFASPSRTLRPRPARRIRLKSHLRRPIESHQFIINSISLLAFGRANSTCSSVLHFPLGSRPPLLPRNQFRQIVFLIIFKSFYPGSLSHRVRAQSFFISRPYTAPRMIRRRRVCLMIRAFFAYLH